MCQESNPSQVDVVITAEEIPDQTDEEVEVEDKEKEEEKEEEDK